jgi:thiosulfate/3-mercaptopyruvate sulfurtransferase
MTEKILFSAQELHALQASGDCLLVDCRFVLADPDAGYKAYLAAHIPAAVYAHLDDDLSSPMTGDSGRHPLPDSDSFAAFLGRIGWQPGVILAVYDNVGGAIAARLWWLMKYFGHDGSAMLDGGIAAWQAAGYQLESGIVNVKPMPVIDFTLREELAVSASELVGKLEGDQIVLADARDRERFAGQVEPIDRVAGHIPGSVNYPYTLNLTSNDDFKPVADIREGLRTLTENQPSRDLVHMCGSGVTACHNIFAAELAGIKESQLYVGSWSEWIQDASRPVKTGA